MGTSSIPTSLFDLKLVETSLVPGTETVVPGWRLAGLLKLGGPREVGARLCGLIELLEPHESLSEEGLTALRASLSDLADAFYGLNEASVETFTRTWRVQPRRFTQAVV